MTFDIGVDEVCVRVGVRYVITNFFRMDSLPNFVTHGAQLRALRARELRYNPLERIITSLSPPWGVSPPREDYHLSLTTLGIITP